MSHMPDIKMTFKGDEIDPKDGGLRFAEYLMIEGMGGPIIDEMAAHMEGFLKKETPDD